MHEHPNSTRLRCCGLRHFPAGLPTECAPLGARIWLNATSSSKFACIAYTSLQNNRALDELRNLSDAPRHLRAKASSDFQCFFWKLASLAKASRSVTQLGVRRMNNDLRMHAFDLVRLDNCVQYQKDNLSHINNARGFGDFRRKCTAVRFLSLLYLLCRTFFMADLAICGSVRRLLRISHRKAANRAGAVCVPQDR